MSYLCKTIVKKSIWKFIDIFPNQVLNFLNSFIEHGSDIKRDTVKGGRAMDLLFDIPGLDILRTQKHEAFLLNAVVVELLVVK